jgi:hypothetical protein
MDKNGLTSLFDLDHDKLVPDPGARNVLYSVILFPQISDRWIMSRIYIPCFLTFLVWAVLLSAAHGSIERDSAAHTVTMADARHDLCIRLKYDGCCYLDQVLVRGHEVVAPDTGVCSAISVGGRWTTTRRGIPTPTVSINGSEVLVNDIAYTGRDIAVQERWRFTVGDDRIDWQISRDYLNGGKIDDTCFPGWDFAAMDTWTGGLLDTGGVAWCRYLPESSSYGAHAGKVTFFNPKYGACLRVTPTVPEGTQVASRFSHQPSGLFSFVQSVTSKELATKYNLHRFNGSLDIWAPFHVEPGTVQVDLALQVLDDNAVRGRGTFVGLDGNAIGNLLDTIGRYGVIDRSIMGGNGWLTGWVCLHEPFFAAMGLAIDDPDYIANFTATLDEWRDHAQKPDGRILSRWHHDTSDNMVPGTYDPARGFYECGWGYTLDSQPDYVINVSEQFDLNGDTTWLRAHKESCEKALDWLLARDTNGNGLVKMMTDSHTNGKSSDWVDVVWASYENALVNAAMYEAMKLWSDRENILGDQKRAAHYLAAAEKLRDAFRRPISEGGFWNPDQGWFAYWRDRDGSIHGDNLVTPVNFCAVAYGLADGGQRKRILDGIEGRMHEEKLFHWPLCFLPYAKGEGANGSFPEYENGDIFLSWGEVGVRAYAGYDPTIAVAYVRRVLDRYRQDGLSFQRYLRRDQEGAGDDILAGNCMTIVGLYRDIYGIRPQWNRLRLDPHLTPELEGTTLSYWLRNQRYELVLGMKRSSIDVAGFTVRAAGSFAVDAADNQLTCFPGDQDQPALTLTRKTTADVTVDIASWPEAKGGDCRWSVSFPGQPVGLHMVIFGLQPQSAYHFQVNGITLSTFYTDAAGRLTVEHAEGQAKTVTFALVRHD